MKIKLAWKNLWRNRRRTYITISAIAFAVLFAVLLASMQRGMEEQMIKTSVDNSLGYIQIHTDGYWDDKLLDNGMFLEDLPLENIEKTNHVSTVEKRLETGMITSFGDQSRGTLVIGYDLEKETPDQIANNIEEGKLPVVGENQVLLGVDLANYLEAKVGDTLVFLGSGYQGATAAGLYELVGTLDFHIPEMNRTTSYIGLSNLQEMVAAPGLITSLVIGLDKPKKLYEVTEELKTTVGNDYEVMSWEELAPDLKQLILTSASKGYIMNFILYMIITFVMFGTVLMATQERKYEMGVLQAIGMKRREATTIAVLENTFISIIGVIVGVVFATPFAYYFNANPITLKGDTAELMAEMGMDPIIPFSIDPTIALNHGLIVLVISMVLVIYPIMVIRKLKPVEAMKL